LGERGGLARLVGALRNKRLAAQGVDEHVCLGCDRRRRHCGRRHRLRERAARQKREHEREQEPTWTGTVHRETGVQAGIIPASSNAAGASDATAHGRRKAKSTSGFRPDTISASAFPEPAAIVQPRVPWPALTYRFGYRVL